MWLEELQLHNFRNYKTLDLRFHPHLNIFLGQNAQGKTNILEAIYFLSLTRSHRAKSDKDLIAFTESSLKVSGKLNRQIGTMTLDVELSDKGRVTKVNHLKQNKLSTYIGQMNVVLFAPEDLQLIKGAPSLRRKFMDIELGQMKPIYLSDLSQYHHILKQRNAYLKQAKRIDKEFLAVLDDQLIDYGSRVMQHRSLFIQSLETYAQQKHFDIAGQDEKMALRYTPSFALKTDEDPAQAFQQALTKSQERDLFKKNTGVGPHRDDFKFFINDLPAEFGSQGQHRSLILSLKLAEIALINQVTQESPILLLDDVMSELDNHRQVQLLETISSQIQTFITTTTLEHLPTLPEDLQIFHVHQGSIKAD